MARTSKSGTSSQVEPDNVGEIIEKVGKQVKRASEYEDNTTILAYGRAKCGKTRFGASAPDVLLVDINEKGTKSVRRDYDPQTVRVSRWGGISDVYWYLKSGNHKHKSVCFDGISSAHTLCLNFVLGEFNALDASRDPDLPRGEVWQKVNQLMKTQITNYRNLPMNVIFTALARDRFIGDDDDMDQDRVTGPQCSPGVATHLEAAVVVIGYLMKREVMVKSKGDKKRHKIIRPRLIVEGTSRYLVGDRTHTLGDYVDNPTVPKILELMKGA